VEELLVALKTLFIKLFEPFLAAFVASLHPSSAVAASGKKGTAVTNLWDFSKSFEGWDKLFDKLLKGFEDKAAEVSKSTLFGPKQRYSRILCRSVKVDFDHRTLKCLLHQLPLPMTPLPVRICFSLLCDHLT
jgi:hypothetical protein